MTKPAAVHVPVMLEEVFEALDLQPGDFYVDGTVGLAGHASVAKEKVGDDGLVLGFDWDEQMLEQAKARLGTVGTRFYRGNFRDIPEVVKEIGRAPNGILLDLGLNSAQLEDPSRGIAFMFDGPLDMRMDRTTGEPASSYINRATEDQLERTMRELGGENWSRRIAKVIIDRRKINPITTTADLVNVVMAAIPPAKRDARIHPATRVFQAFRIHATRELDRLQDAIELIAMTLAPGGTLVVLSYHDGEDRPTKHAFRSLSQDGEFIEITKKPVGPSLEEIARNPRSRSAKMRVLRRK